MDRLNLGTENRRAEEFLKIRISDLSSISPSFQNHKLLGTFRINGKQEYCTDAEYEKLIPKDAYERKIGTFLGTGYENAELIEDYYLYHKLKHDYFLKWLIESRFFEGVEERKYKKPDFICFGSRISDPMITPCITRFGDWEIFAAKFNDSIFLWHEKCHDARDIESFYGIYFEHILTKQNPEASPPNVLENTFVINEVTFGSHQILCMSEIDAVNDNGEWVEIKVYKECPPKGLSGKHLKYWAQSIVPGVKHLIIGKRDNSGRLLDIKDMTVDTIAMKFEWRPETCYQFEHRLLQWIKSHFTENNPKIVKKFTWIFDSHKVTSANVVDQKISKTMFPEWFVDGVMTVNVMQI